MGEQVGAQGSIVTMLLQRNAEHLPSLQSGRLIGRVDTQHTVAAAALGAQNFERFGLVIGGDDAVRDLAADEAGGGHIARVAQGGPISKG
jgi:hypothetical protein